jgi:hypothetical protein
MPTINSWRGDSQAIPQVTRITIPSVAGETQIFTLTINHKDVDGSGATASDVYEAWFDAWSDTSNPIPAEFAELTPELEGEQGAYTALILTGEEDGRPFEISGSSSSDTAEITVTTTQTGVAALNEIQRYSFTASGGTYTLEFDGQVTGAIAYNAVAATIQTALEALSNIAVGDVTVSGTNPFNVEFKLAYAATDVALLIGNGSSLTGAVTIGITESQKGYAGLNTIYRLTWETVGGSNTPAGNYPFVWTWPYFTGTPITFTLSPSDTQAVAQAALEAVVGAGNVVVTGTGGGGGYFDIEFTGIYAGVDTSSNLPGGLETAPSGDGNNYDLEATQLGVSTPRDEKQLIQFSGTPTGGTFRLTFRGQQTATIAYNASAATVKTELEALTTITTVTVTKPSAISWLVEFDDPGGEDLPKMIASANSLTGVVIPVVVYQVASPAIAEIQQIDLPVTATGGTFTISYAGQTTSAITYPATAATVLAALEALSNIAPGDVSVSRPGDSTTYVVTFLTTGALTGNVAAITANGDSLTLSAANSVIVYDDTLATGPEWFDEPDNWSSGALPADAETLVYENSNRSCKYGIKHSFRYGGEVQSISAANPTVITTTAAHGLVTGRTVKIHGSDSTPSVDGDQVVTVTGANTFTVAVNVTVAGTQARWAAYLKYVNPDKIRQEASFTGDMGLPEEEGDYHEYRPTRLALGDAGYGTMEVEIGYGDGQGSELSRYDFGEGQVALTCWLTSNGRNGFPALDVVGTHVDNVFRFYKGIIGIGILESDTAAFDSCEITCVSEGDVKLLIGNCNAGVTAGSIYNNGGEIHCEAALPGEVVQRAGLFYFDGIGDSADITLYSGTFFYNSSGDFDVIIVSGDAVLDFDHDLRTKQGVTPGTTAIEKRTPQSKIKDNNKVVAQLIIDHPYGAAEGVELGEHVRLTRGTPA